MPDEKRPDVQPPTLQQIQRLLQTEMLALKMDVAVIKADILTIKDALKKKA